MHGTQGCCGVSSLTAGAAAPIFCGSCCEYETLNGIVGSLELARKSTALVMQYYYLQLYHMRTA